MRFSSIVPALATLVLATTAMPAQADAPVEVAVYKTPPNAQGNALYQYKVTNNTEHNIVALRIGFDYIHGVPELNVPPVGWALDFPIPAGSSISPPGWAMRVVTTEESQFYELEWSSDNGQTNDIHPSTMEARYAIFVQGEDPTYETSHFDVILGDSTHVSALLVAGSGPPPVIDHTPPTISIQLTPSRLWPPTHKQVRIVAEVSVQDDQDPAPIVRLVSIDCNEPVQPAVDITGAMYNSDDREFFLLSERLGQSREGRRYTVTYSATDSAGNSATATAVVAVSHDQRSPK